MEILANGIPSEATLCRMEEGKAASTSNVQAQKPEYIPEVGEAPEIDDVTRNLIASTMAAFRR